ncbi:MAG: methyltransferase domain-containing protein [Chthoniobacterales bacterium]
MPRQFDSDQPEQMDLPQPVSAELEKDLDNLRKLNSWFGSYRLIRHFLRRWLKPGASVRILDLATGSGDIPREIVRWCRARHITVEIDAVDFHPSTLEIAKKRNAEFPEIRHHQADARNFSPGEQWDIVICSLALHHFSDSDAVQVLKRCHTLSGKHVLVADLCRTPFAKFGIWFITATIFRHPMTKYDGRLSIARAFSHAEMHQLAQDAGWKDFGQWRFAIARQAIWMDQTK